MIKNPLEQVIMRIIDCKKIRDMDSQGVFGWRIWMNYEIH